MVRLDLRDDDLVGTFACPDGEGPFTPVLTLGGSDGGIAELYLNLLVSEGFACLALAYLGAAHLQRSLVEVPIERVERGLRWLAAQPQAATRDGRVGVIGGSKGGELALLAAATYPDLVGPVAAYTPSTVVWAGIDFFNPRNMQASRWSRDGQALPFVPYPAGVTPTTSERGLSVLPIYDRGLDNAEAVERAAMARADPAAVTTRCPADADDVRPGRQPRRRNRGARRCLAAGRRASPSMSRTAVHSARGGRASFASRRIDLLA